MAEIRSTLDLVMERTRNLSMSAADRDAQARDEFLKKLNGVMQRLEDGRIRAEDAEREISGLAAPLGASGRGTLLRGLAARLDLERDNRPLLELLKKACGAATGPVDALLGEYRDAVRAVDEQSAADARKILEAEHRISGSAVVAVPETDPNWAAKRSALRSDFGQRLERAIAGLEQGR